MPKVHGYNCSAYGCLSRQFDKDGKSFFSFPKDPGRLKAWLQALNRNNLAESFAPQLFSWQKEGGLVYFNIGTENHVLSQTFQIKDSQSRGLRRWFSFVVLMKDKMMLLNLMPFLSKSIKKIVNEVQAKGTIVYENDQKICSQRALRLNSGTNDFGPSRSFFELTDDADVYKKLHCSLSWILQNGARTYTETLFTSEQLLSNSSQSSINEDINHSYSLRSFNSKFNSIDFRKVLYCTLCGIQLRVAGTTSQSSEIVMCLKELLPWSNASLDKYINLAPGDEVIHSSATVCLIEEKNYELFVCNWPGVLPNKCPSLMIKIESAILNDKMNDVVLKHHTESLKNEWLNLVRVIKSAAKAVGISHSSVVQLKKSLGVGPYDELLLNYWIQHVS